METEKKSTKKEAITTLETSNAVCEHCGQEQAHDVLGDNGKCDTCNKLVRKGLF